MDEAFPQRRAKLLWEAQGPRWKAPGSSGTHGCSSGHQIPGAQRLLPCQHGGPSPAGSSLLPLSWHWVSHLGSSQLAPLPHVRASHECRCCSATKNGDRGYKNTRSGGEGDVFLLVGHLQEAPHRRGWPRRPNGASPSGEAWLEDSPEERAEHPRNLPGWIRARLFQSAA